jgi:hypothetical protein
MKLMQNVMTAVLLCIVTSALASATSVYVGTNNNAAAWSAFAGAGGSGTPFQTPSGLSITSNTTITGTPLPGASLAQWDGFWFATLHFSLPADAMNPMLSITSLGSDDRMVIRLNGNDIADNLVAGGGGPGVFDFGSGDQPYNFSGNTNFVVSSGLIIGGVNTLAVYVNNTGSRDPSAVTRGFVNQTDGTDASFSATVGFTERSAVPEPETWSTLALGIGLVGASQMRRLRRNR